jgi:Chitobiase/beta-hexosaminidase C-terminal domain/Carboxylesterase family
MKKAYLLAFLALPLAWPGSAVTDEPKRSPRPVNTAKAINIPYLPERLTGADRAISAGSVDFPEGQDRRVMMDIYWPLDGKKHPCIIFVHGGGYGNGDKAMHSNLLQEAVDRGFVAVTLNYILNLGFSFKIKGTEEQIFPQVFWDFKAAVRFLRQDADRLAIDPNRIGAMGFSAGGWLISSAGYGDAGDIMIDSANGIPAVWPANSAERQQAIRGLEQGRKFLVGMDNPRPVYGDYSSRLSALEMDFHRHHSLVTPDDPASLTYVGVGGTNPLEQPCRKAGVDYTALVLLEEKYNKANSLHVPPLTAKVLSEDGRTEIMLMERVYQWFQRQLVTDPRSVAPEFRPNRREFADSQVIQMVVPSADSAIHYTSDGSEPTPQSPVYKGPFTVRDTTTIKAFAVRKGERSSGVATAVFTKGEVPPVITGPAKLPEAKIGQPYSVQFSKEGDRPVVWRLVGHPLGDESKPGVSRSQVMGLDFDPQSATLAGTPTKAGAFTFQVQAAWAFGKPAETRTYVLFVDK